MWEKTFDWGLSGKSSHRKVWRSSGGRRNGQCAVQRRGLGCCSSRKARCLQHGARARGRALEWRAVVIDTSVGLGQLEPREG